MNASRKSLSVAHEWIAKAENDLKTAEHTLKLGESSPTDTICFHAQQRVEKYLKAFLTWKGIEFPKTHNIESIAARLPKNIFFALSSIEQDRLTEYATTARYPGDYDPITLAEARKAVRLARRVRREMRKLLPQEVLRPPKRE